MIRAYVPGCVCIALRERSHPLFAAQFAPEEFAHFVFLRRREIFGHVVENRQEVVAMPDFVEGSVGLAAAPISFSFHVEQTIDALGQGFGLRTQFSGAGGVAAAFVHIGDDAHAVYIAGIHSSHFVQVGADDFEQVLDRRHSRRDRARNGRVSSSRGHVLRDDRGWCDRRSSYRAKRNRR